MGSSDMDNWIWYAKESVTAFWDKPAEKSVRYFLYMSFTVYMMHNASVS